MTRAMRPQLAEHWKQTTGLTLYPWALAASRSSWLRVRTPRPRAAKVAEVPARKPRRDRVGPLLLLPTLIPFTSSQPVRS